ncbi:MAG: hypothetical protein KBF88_17205 [Polyangiaceae bacterium]|nr:hypothetical protein [Polyangiaceae bacterium]
MLIVGKVRKREELDALQDGVTVVPVGAQAPANGDPNAIQKGRIVPRVIVDAHEEAKRILETAEREADTLRKSLAATSEEERTRIIETTRQEELAKLANLRLSLEKDVRSVPKELAERATAATLLVLERFLRKEVTAHESEARALFLSAIEEVRSTRGLSVECTALDEATLRSVLRDHFGLEGESIQIRANETLARGDLVLNVGSGSIDARIVTRIDRLAPVVLDALYEK